MITSDERKKLHTLLDVMIDENESRATLSSATGTDDKMRIIQYNLSLTGKTDYVE